MNKKMKAISKILVLFSTILIFSCNNNERISTEKTYVPFTLVSTIKLNDSVAQKQIKNRGFVIVDEDQIKHLVNDSDGVYYYDFRKNIDYSIFDFSNFDYVISRGSEIDSLSHSEFYTKTMDFCKDIVRKALEVKHKQGYNSSLLFIYKLKDKNKYRSPCG